MGQTQRLNTFKKRIMQRSSISGAYSIRVLTQFVCLFLCGFSTAEQLFDAAIEANTVLLESFVEKTRIPGLAVAVAVGDEIVWSQGFGYANLELDVPVTPQSKFRIASISKLLTGTCVGILVEEGKLDLERPISDYIESIPEKWRNITAWQLAEHTSGIGHYTSREDALNTTYYETTQAALGYFSDRPLLHHPGKKKTYSSYAYTVLAAVIEGASGENYLESINRTILLPLGMTNTVPDVSWKVIPQRTAYYEFDDDRRIRIAPFIDLSNRWAGSGYLSTVEDLAQFGAAHTAPGFLSEKSLKLIITLRYTSERKKLDEGLGWAPRVGWDGRSMIWGDGSTPGARGGLLVFPEQRLSIALLTNARGAPIERGDLQSIALRFLFAIESKQLRELTSEHIGDYDLKLHVSGNEVPSTLSIERAKNGFGGVFDLGGYQQFDVADAILIENKLWVLCLGEGTGLLNIGVLPIQLEINGSRINGRVLRTDITIEGIKSSKL